MSLFTILPVQSDNLTLPVIPATDIRRLSGVENDAYGHWIFDRGASSLESLVDGTMLTVQGAAPIYGSNHVEINNTHGNALLTALEDSASTNMTLSAVVSAQDLAQLMTLMGVLGDAANGTGFGAYLNTTGTLAANCRGLYSFSLPGPFAADTFYFVSLSRNFGGSSKITTLYVGGFAPASQSSTSTYLPATAGRKIAIGNGYYTGTTSKSIKCGEFVVHHGKALTTDEQYNLYLRSKARMADRGITI